LHYLFITNYINISHLLAIKSFVIDRSLGLRRDTLDGNDDRVRDLPPRGGHQGAGNLGYMGGRQGRPPTQRRDRRDERRRTTDDEDTVLDSQDVSSIDRGNNIYS